MPSLFKAIKLDLQQGQIHQAAAKLETVNTGELNPLESREFQYISAVTYRYLGDLSRAELTLKSLLATFPNYEMAWQEQGHLKLVQGQKREAQQSFNQAVTLNWALKSSWLALSTLHSEQENSQELAWCKVYLELLQQLDGQFLKWLFQCFAGPADKQLPEIMAASGNKKLNLAERFVVATCLFKAERYAKAEALLLELLPSGNHLVQYLLANVTAKKQDFYASLTLAKGLMELYPDLIPIRFLYANQLMATDQFEQAEQYYRSIVAQVPQFEQVWLNLGHMAKTQGNGLAAIDYYHNAIGVRETCGDAYWSLANLKNFDFDERQLNKMTNLVEKDLADEDKAALNFALGYAFERKGVYQKSFDYYLKGNDLKHKNVTYTRDFLEREFSSSCDANWRSALMERTEIQDSEPTPIFVLGMPRAGSTLLEQILAAHSKVSATYELPHILTIAKQLNQNAVANGLKFYPQQIESITVKQITGLKEQYLAKVAPLNIKTPYFIDKMPNNFRHIGLLKLMFPKAKIIDIRRDRMACCFSNFKQHYGQGQEFSYNWHDVTHYYDKYVALMSFWQQTFTGEIHQLHYETLVKTPEQVLQSLMSYLGLELESACLGHHKTVTKVKTASAEQVREAIHHRGLEYWRAYKDYLEQL